jgi:ABC-type multidrug transport system fused ATPase/permease subunit
MPTFISSYVRILIGFLSDSISRYKAKSLLIVIASAIGLLSQILAFAIIFYYVNHVASGELIRIYLLIAELTFDPRSSLGLLTLVSGTVLLLLVIFALLVFYSRSLSIKISRLYNEHCVDNILAITGGPNIPFYSLDQIELSNDKFFHRLLISDARVCARVLRLVLTLIFPVLTLIVCFFILFYLDTFLTCIIFFALLVYLFLQGNISKQASNFSSVFEIHTPAASKRITNIFNNANRRQLGFSANIKTQEEIFNFGPIKKQLDAYEARQRYVEYSRLVSGIFLALILGLITLMMGERILASKSGWGELVIFVVALRAAMMNLQPVFNKITSINRFYPQLRRYINFIHGNRAHCFNSSNNNEIDNAHVDGTSILYSSESFPDMDMSSRTGIVYPYEINKISAYYLLNLISEVLLKKYYLTAGDAALITSNQLISDVFNKHLIKLFRIGEINSLRFPQLLLKEIDDFAVEGNKENINFSSFSDQSKFLISAITAVISDKKILLLDSSGLEKLSSLNKEFIFHLLHERMLLIVYKDIQDGFLKWGEQNIILVAHKKIIGMGSLKWMQENRQEIDAALLKINQKPNRKASNVVIDDDQDEY